MEEDGIAMFIQCTSSLCFNCCQLRGSLFVYERNQSKWRLGITDSFNYNMDGNSDDMVSFYEWIGAVIMEGYPEMFECTDFDDLSHHVKHRTLCINDVHAYFVNQVCVILL